METEWDMQERLTQKWLEEGAFFDDKRVFLAAWEVMINSWEINDAHRRWNEPSIDFLFIDVDGNIWLVEMKRQIKTPRDAWSALCQVTHRAIVLGKTYSYSKLEFSYTAAYSGQHGRKKENSTSIGFLRAHQNFFKLSKPIEKAKFGSGVFRRVIAAKYFSNSWEGIKIGFDEKNIATVQKHIRENYTISKTTREFKRFMDLEQNEWNEFYNYPTSQWIVS
jgi:hypothetical protein